jgi:hypothetical protein
MQSKMKTSVGLSAGVFILLSLLKICKTRLQKQCKRLQYQGGRN